MALRKFKFFLLFLLLSAPVCADYPPLCTLPSIGSGYYKPFYGTHYSFTYNDSTKKLYYTLPEGQFTIYENIPYNFAHGFTYVGTTPAQFVQQAAIYHTYLEAENCNPILAENGNKILAQ